MNASLTDSLSDYHSRAHQHRPSDESVLAREVSRLLANGLKPRDVAQALHIHIEVVLLALKEAA